MWSAESPSASIGRATGACNGQAACAAGGTRRQGVTGRIGAACGFRRDAPRVRLIVYKCRVGARHHLGRWVSG